MKIPTEPLELLSALPDAAAEIGKDPAYWAYALTRGAFFTAQALSNAALAGSEGAVESALRRNGAAALEVKAPSEVKADVLETGAVLPSPAEDPGAFLAGSAALIASQAELYRRDAANVAAGVYRRPWDANVNHRQAADLARTADQSRRLLEATRSGAALREARWGTQAVDAHPFEDVSAADDGVPYPEYYRQNFHYQEDGWLSAKSAAVYEYQTEALFTGSQDAMQRSCLAAVSAHVERLKASGVAESDIRLYEVAAGTGRVMTFVVDNWPQMKCTCSDLSPHYLAAARENLAYHAAFEAEHGEGRPLAPVAFRRHAAEAIPAEDESLDVLLCVYLFHELPNEVRRQCAAEWFRALKPGGCVAFNDSIQRCDRPDMGPVFPMFPDNYHEPYYMDYVDDDLEALFEEAGFVVERHGIAHMSKWLSLRKPPL